jgi:hypothetical protein
MPCNEHRRDPKLAWDHPQATFLNITWSQWLGVTPDLLRPGSPPANRTHWRARLFPAAAERDENLALTLADLMERWYAGTGVSVWPAAIAAEGLNVSAFEACACKPDSRNVLG